MHGLIHNQRFVWGFIGIRGRLRLLIPLLRRRNRRKRSVRLLWWLAFHKALSAPGTAVPGASRTGGGGLRFGWRPGHHDTLNCEKYSTKGEPAMPEVSFARKIAGVS